MHVVVFRIGSIKFFVGGVNSLGTPKIPHFSNKIQNIALISKKTSNLLYIKIKVIKIPFINWKHFFIWLRCWWVIGVWTYVHFLELWGAVDRHSHFPKKNFFLIPSCTDAYYNPWKFQFIWSKFKKMSAFFDFWITVDRYNFVFYLLPIFNLINLAFLFVQTFTNFYWRFGPGAGYPRYDPEPYKFFCCYSLEFVGFWN